MSELESRVFLSAVPAPAATADALSPAITWSLNASASKSTITITWSDQSTGMTGFEIDRGINKDQLIKVASVAADQTSFQDSPPKSGVRYYYTVRGYNRYGVTDAPAPVSAGLAVTPVKVTLTPQEQATQAKAAAAAAKAAAAKAAKAAQMNAAAALAAKEDQEMLEKQAAANASKAGSSKKSSSSSKTSSSSGSKSSSSGSKSGSSSSSKSKSSSSSSSGTKSSSSGSKSSSSGSSSSGSSSGSKSSSSGSSSSGSSSSSKSSSSGSSSSGSSSGSEGNSSGSSSSSSSSSGNSSKLSTGSGYGTEAPISTPDDSTVIYVGPSRSVKSVDAALDETGKGKSYTIVIDPGTYNVSHHSIYGNVTITAADDSDEPVLKMSGDNYPTLYVNDNLVIDHVQTKGGSKIILLGSTVGANINAQDITMTDGGGIWRGSGGNNIYFKDNDVLGKPYTNVYGNFNETVNSCTIDNSGTDVSIPQGGTVSGDSVISGETAIRVMDVDNLTLVGVETKPFFWKPGQEWKQDIQLRPSSKLIRLIDCTFYEPDVGDMTWREPAHPVDEVDFINCTIAKDIKLEAGAKLVKIENTTINGKVTNTTESYA